MIRWEPQKAGQRVFGLASTAPEAFRARLSRAFGELPCFLSIQGDVFVAGYRLPAAGVLSVLAAVASTEEERTSWMCLMRALLDHGRIKVYLADE